jgi:hypothetical protein
VAQEVGDLLTAIFAEHCLAFVQTLVLSVERTLVADFRCESHDVVEILYLGIESKIVLAPKQGSFDFLPVIQFGK